MDITNAALFDLSKTIASNLFVPDKLPFTVLDQIGDFILQLGPCLDKERFDQTDHSVWIAKSVHAFAGVTIVGPCIIDEDTELRPGAFIRQNVIIGKHCVIGNSTEIKNSVLLDCVQVPHYNYIGDSILGYRSHFGASALTSNIKSDKSPVIIHDGSKEYKTGRRKVGAFIGDYVEIGCGSVLNPGTVLGRNTTVYPLTSLRGCIPSDMICKKSDWMIPKQ